MRRSRVKKVTCLQPLFVAVCVGGVLMLLGSKSALAQSSLRKAVYGTTPATETKKPPPPPVKKAVAPKKIVARPAAKTKKPSAVAAVKKKAATGTSTRRTATRPGWINVVFESKEPNTQVFLNNNLVGTTDENRTFKRMMTPGIYRIRGVLGAGTVFPEKLIQLGADGMNIRLYEEVVSKAPETIAAPLVIPKTQAEIEIELAREMRAKVIKIFADFTDPQKSADITIDDWKFAANAAVLGEFQNLSKQQIEAQRKFAAGQAALAEGNRKKAFADFSLAVQNFATSPLPHIGLGDTYFASAQWQDAARSYEKARSVGPNFWMAHLRLGEIYRILGEKKKAVISYTDAVKFGDNRYETRFLRARALVDAEEIESAAPLLEDLLKEKPTSVAYLALGEAYEMQKREVAALDNYRKAVEIDPGLPIAQYRLARIYYEQREYQKAVEGFDAAIKLDGERRSFPHDDARIKRSNASTKIRTVSK